MKALPEAPYVLVFTAGDVAGELPSDRVAGIDGYLDKRSSSEELLDSTRRVAAGEKVWKKGGPTGERDGVSPEGPPLTPREMEVLAMKLQRRTNAEIAAALHISLNTVKHHVTSIYKKLAKTRKDLLRT
jgi:DNA-binding NarL/FixJ family response regulator